MSSGKSTKFVVERLTNYNNTAEGPVLPPKQFGPNRVPIVTNLRVIKTELNLGNTNFTLAWDNPQEVNQTSSIVDHFNIYVFGAFKGSRQPLGPTTAQASPAIVAVPCDRATNVTLLVQTVLKSGLASAIDLSPTCGGATFAPTLSISGIGSLGSANQILGVNAGATALEYKTVSVGTVGTSFNVANAANSLVINLPVITVKLGADRTNNTTSFADATDLSFAVAANTDYLFDFNVIFQTDAVTTGISLSVNGPAAPTAVLYDTVIYDGTNVVTANVRAYDTGTATAAIDAANTSTYAKVRGIFRNGANAGTFILRFKSEVGASTVTIKAGSSGTLTTY